MFFLEGGELCLFGPELGGECFLEGGNGADGSAELGAGVAGEEFGGG